MSDAGRKPMTDKISESIVPDSSKSTQQKMKEGVTDIGDKGARGAQTDDSKSSGQSMVDKMGRTKDEEKHGGTGGSVLDSAKNMVGMDKK
ncbi:MAG: hypothetical protein M1828_003822 [Chrysothrix sp. TS-e1954]|nr:MAG: hypothetical protein M1828_003822 [Chrysothrix sp. TS-e1954]